jgi:hypothetical protein
MRKHIVPGMLLAAAIGLGLPIGLSQVKAEDVAAFPPDMLGTPAAAPIAAKVLPPTFTPPASDTLAAAPSVSPDAPAPSAITASSDALPTGSTTRATQPVKPVAVVKLHRKHFRHVAHARRVPLPPVRAAALPKPAPRVVQTAAVTPACPGFCGKYVLVGVGF